MVKISIDEEDLLELLMNRVEHWTERHSIDYKLFEEMYNNYIYNGCFEYFEGLDVTIAQIVDNDYVNNCRVVYPSDSDYVEIKKVYDEQGIGDCSCETDTCDYIEAEYLGHFLVR